MWNPEDSSKVLKGGQELPLPQNGGKSDGTGVFSHVSARVLTITKPRFFYVVEKVAHQVPNFMGIPCKDT